MQLTSAVEEAKSLKIKAKSADQLGEQVKALEELAAKLDLKI